MSEKSVPTNRRVCPWWLISTFDNPLRRFFHDPRQILAGLVQEGDKAADIGCGIGYFSLPLARMVGPSGRLLAIDLQPRMLAGLRRRAVHAGLLERIELHQAQTDSLGISLPVGINLPLDFVLAFWMVHEVPDTRRLLQEIHDLLRPGKQLLVVEPRLHVPAQDFERTIATAVQVGFRREAAPAVRFSRAILFSTLPI